MQNNGKERGWSEQVPGDVSAGDVNDDAGRTFPYTADFFASKSLRKSIKFRSRPTEDSRTFAKANLGNDTFARRSI